VSGEDCLNLNIWTPDPGSAGLPVMVWIPGGMFEFGTGASYDGSRFARDGIVCVSINYRVGAEGFLYLADGAANLGLLDQIAALGWVRDNIAAFGGDPGNVTIFGQSAGAMSVGTLLAIPAAKGLFGRAIAQSGAAHQVASAATALRVGRYLADLLAVEATQEAIAGVPVDRVLAAQAQLKADLFAHPDPERWGADTVTSTLLWQPVIDGELIAERPLARIGAGAGADVDLLVGTNVDDWRLFSVVSGSIEAITEQILTAPVSAVGFLSLAAYGLAVDKALAAYRAHYPGVSPGDLLAAVQTDWWCRIPAIRLADAHVGGGASTYMYEFACVNSVRGTPRRLPRPGGGLRLRHSGQRIHIRPCPNVSAPSQFWRRHTPTQYPRPADLPAPQKCCIGHGPASRPFVLATLIPGVGRALNNVYDEVQDPVLTSLMRSYPRVVNDVKDRVRGLRGGRAML
jgi:para-nitrobenzyl esterase